MKPDEYGVRLDDMVGNHPGATASQHERLPGADCALGENGLKLEKKERICRLSPQAMKNKLNQLAVKEEDFHP